MGEVNGKQQNGHNQSAGGRQRSAGIGSLSVAMMRQRAVEFGVASALTMLGRTSEDNYGRLTSLLDKFAFDENKRMVTGWIKQWTGPGQPGAEWLKHILTTTHPNVRKRWISRFVSGVVFHDADSPYRLPDGREVPVPAILVISPTMRCNLSCFGCYAGSYTKKDDLTVDEVTRVLSEAREMGTRFFIITGGEPLMYKPLFDIIERFDDCAFQIYTSGHLMTPEIARRMVELGNVAACVSVEGFREHTDQRRGPGGFDRVIQAFRYLREAGAMYGFSLTPTHLNIDVVTSDEFFQWLVDQGCHFGYMFSYLPVGRNPDVNLMLTPDERNKLRIGGKRFRNNFPMIVADFFSDGVFVDGCLCAGRRYVHINNKGDVEPCVFQHFAVDNIREKPLAECLASDYFVALRKAAPYGRNLLRPCPMIDHPKVLRTLVKRYDAKPTHEGAEALLSGEIAEHLDRYSEGVREVFDPVIAKEYRWVAKLLQNPDYDFVEHPPRGHADEPVLGEAEELKQT